MLQLRKNGAYREILQRQNPSTKGSSRRLPRKHDRRRKNRNEGEIGFWQRSVKDSPSSLISDKCVYESLVPSEYISLDSIIYEIKQKEGKIRNTSIRDKENKLRNMTPAWMIRQLWKYPDQGITQLRTYA